MLLLRMLILTWSSETPTLFIIAALLVMSSHANVPFQDSPRPKHQRTSSEESHDSAISWSTHYDFEESHFVTSPVSETVSSRSSSPSSSSTAESDHLPRVGLPHIPQILVTSSSDDHLLASFDNIPWEAAPMVLTELDTSNKMPPGAMTPPSTPSGHHRSKSSLSVPYPDSPSILSRPHEKANDYSLNAPLRQSTNGKKQRHISFAADTTSMGHLPTHGRSHYRIRRFIRMLKKAPWFLKALFLFWTLGMVALVMNAVTELRTGSQSRPGWRELQKRFGQREHGEALCDP